ncbi:MAG: hypothetical protein ABI282_11740 [Candidatus Baltobacteraceae bacterium]
MRLRTQLGSFVGTIAAISLVAGCSGGGSQLPSAAPQGGNGQTTQSVTMRGPLNHTGTSLAARNTGANRKVQHLGSWFIPNHNPITSQVFVGDSTNSVVEIFDFKTRTQTGQIGGLNAPEGLTTDSAGNLYESDTGTNQILVFKSPYTGSPRAIADPSGYPVGNHVDGNGDLWVANICSTASGCAGGGAVLKYTGAKGTPTSLKNAPYRTYFVTTDANGNVWADGQNSSGSAVIGYWKAGAGSFKTVAISLVFPGSLQFDKAGNLLLVDQSGDPTTGGSIMNIYPPGSTTPSGSIILQTTGDDVISAALGTAQARIFAPLYLTGTSGIISYPAGAMVNTLTPTTIGNPDAVAVTPSTLP